MKSLLEINFYTAVRYHASRCRLGWLVGLGTLAFIGVTSRTLAAGPGGESTVKASGNRQILVPIAPSAGGPHTENGPDKSATTAIIEPPPPIVEEFTGALLPSRTIKIGTDLEYGLLSTFTIGTDVVSNLIGAPSLHLKTQLWNGPTSKIAFGLRGAWLNKKTLLWGNMSDHFDTLDARAIRPSIAYTKRISDRLNLHTFWAIGVGHVRAKLSETGRRKLWEQKHPDRPYPGDESGDESSAPSGDNEDSQNGEIDPTDSAKEIDSSKNQEDSGRDESVIAQRSAQVQSLTGLAQDRFQITGEFMRKSGHRVLITSRVERSQIEELKTRSFRMTIAQHWLLESFQFRLGGGFQHMQISGEDLDGETVDEDGWWPATDLAFYWQF